MASTTNLNDEPLDDEQVATSELGEDWKPPERKFDLPVDPEQHYKATKLKILSFARPHMRAFHYSWWSFFIAFFIWFSIAPLLPEIRDTLSLSKSEIWLSNICGVSADIFMRFVFGAITDSYGARLPMGAVLTLASIPTAMTGIVNSLAGLCTLRFFIGIAGSSFVMCQCWSTRMFTKEIVGTANALVGGWGNVGGGVTQIVMGTLLFPLFRMFFDGSDDPSEMAWRTVCVVPAVVAFITAIVVVSTSEDCPEGNYSELKKNGTMVDISASASFRQGAHNFNTWLLFIQYGCCFGVELTMNNAAASYFVDEFGLSTESASAIASVFGFMNIFARGLGGFVSDHLNARMGMRGRFLAQMGLLLLEGVCIYVFSFMQELWSAIVMLTIFSIFVQGAEGSTYGIVPYVNPTAPGAVAGIVGAGGPTGAVSFGLGFLFLNDIKHAYWLMASLVIVSGLLCFLFDIKGHGSLLHPKTEVSHDGAISVPVADKETAVEPAENANEHENENENEETAQRTTPLELQ